MMSYLITLYLLPPQNTLEFIKSLPWAKELTIDIEYGLVLISPRKSLYTIRAKSEHDLFPLLDDYPEIIKGIHGDVRIHPFS